jgi:lysophospholipase
VLDIRTVINFSIPYVGGADPDSFYETIFENAGAKADAGFPISVADPFGQFWGNWLPKAWTYANFSDLATKGGSFASGHAPMPIMVLAEVIPGQSPEIGGFMFPGRDDANGFNLTSYEVTPFEFGSWLGGRVQAFMPTQWLGTAMDNGSAVDSGRCALGFDKFTFIQGTTTNAFTAWLIDAFYDIPIFAKRRLWSRHGLSRDIELPPEASDNVDAALVQDTASQFNQTFNESLWARYPNPFRGYNDAMTGVSELLLVCYAAIEDAVRGEVLTNSMQVDGSLTGETNPIRPLIIPDRALDFIIVYEASSDATNAWVNGTNLISTSKPWSSGDRPFLQSHLSQTQQNRPKRATFRSPRSLTSTPWWPRTSRGSRPSSGATPKTTRPSCSTCPTLRGLGTPTSHLKRSLSPTTSSTSQ